MEIIKGKAVCGGIAFGKLSFFERGDVSVKRRKIDDIKAEKERFENAKKMTLKQLDDLYKKALKEVGETNAQIFDIHKMMVEDADYNDSVNNMIENQNVNAEYAVAVTSDNFAMMFSSMDDEYMKGRAADVKDISNRIIRNLEKSGEQNSSSDDKLIICSDDLAPSETVQLDKSKVLGFVTQGGSTSSHTAILARTMNIPAIIGVGEALNPKYNGKNAIIDGFSGKVYIEPDEETSKKLKRLQEEDRAKKELLERLKGKENVTKTGKKINIFANISGIGDIGSAIVNDAGGIGLFRSEFLYLEDNDYPSESLQFETYKKVLESMAGKKVIIRTLDIGADKKIGYFNLKPETNPALGYRAIRICLTRPEIFKTQLRALYRASVFGNLGIMFPMIISTDEVKKIYEIIDEVQAELDDEGLPYSKNVEIGIMIETPASVMISDELAQLVDFFSVGTNDLTQYTLAIDRQNPELESFYDPHHEAILREIKIACDNAHKYGKWIGICGELGADLDLTDTFLEMGIDEISVSPPKILPLRNQVVNSEV